MKPTFPAPVIITGLLILLASFALMRVAALGAVHISDATLLLGGMPSEPQGLPWKQEYSGEYAVRVSVAGVTESTHRFRIFPDDELLSIQVNGKPLALDKISLNERRNYEGGFAIDIPELLLTESNALEFRLKNESGPAGFNFKSERGADPLVLVVAFIVLMGFALVLCRHIRIERSQLVLLALGIAVSLVYLSVTNSHTRSFDVYEEGGHLDYVNHLIVNRALPDPSQGWEFHQPPLYYLIAAAGKTMAGRDAPSELWGQLLALQLWMVFLVAGLGCLRHGLVARGPLVLASAALVLWPAGIIHSIRIGNDAAMYAFFGLSFLYAVRWWSRRRPADLVMASVWMMAVVISKSSGLAMSAVLCMLVLLDALRRRRRVRDANARRRIVRNVLIVAGFIALGFAINFGDNIAYYLRGTASDWLLSNVSTWINDELRVSNSVEKYLIFDLATFLQHPFMSTWDDKYGRQYFWNFLLRSSLTSEYFFDGKALTAWGIANGALLLAALAALPIYLLQKVAVAGRRSLYRDAYRHLPWLLAGGMLLLLLLAYRIKTPFSCNTDFRYIYPALICALYFIAQTWRRPLRFPLASGLALGAPLIAANTLLWIVVLRWF